MNKRIITLCGIIIAFSLCFTAFSAGIKVEKTDITTANAKTYYAEKDETTTSSSLGGLVGDVMNGLGSGSSSDGVDSVLGNIEGVSDKVDGAIGGFGDAIGGIGDAFGGIGDGSSGLGDALGGIGSGSSGGLGSGLGDIFGGVLGGSGSTNVTSAPNTTQSSDAGIIIPVPAATQTTAPAEENTSKSEIAVEGETVDYAATDNPYKKPTGTYSAGDEDEGIKWLQWIFIFTHYGLSDNGITGVLDEDTVAVVKKLQQENKLTVDGNITEDVIKAAEVLYYQTILGDDVSAIEVSSEATTGKGVSYDSVENNDRNEIPAVLLIVVLVIVWILAIGGIVLLFIFKKKKITASKATQEKETEKTQDNTQAQNKEGISSLSDLFEEAEKKD